MPDAEPPTPTAKAASYLDTLTEFGFRPKVDADGDVAFMYEGGHYYLMARDTDDGYFQLLYPYFFEYDPDFDRIRVLETAARLNYESKVAKVYPVGTNDVSASIELFVGDLEGYKPILLRSLRQLQSVAHRFRRIMRGEEN